MAKIAIFGDSITKGRIGIDFKRYLKREASFYGQDASTFSPTFNRAIRHLESESVDLAVIQAGVNDLLIPHMRDISSKWDAIASSIYKKERANFNLEQFLLKFENHLKSYNLNTPLLICSLVPIGEDLNSFINNQRSIVNIEIKRIIDSFNNIYYCDITSDLVKLINQEKRFSQFLIPDPTLLEKDALFVRSDEQRSLELSSERDLTITIDGIHPNSIGSKSIAVSLESCFKKLLHD